MRPVENSCLSPLYRTTPTRASRLSNADGQSSSVAKSSPIGWCRAISSSAAVECRARRATRSAEQARYRRPARARSNDDPVRRQTLQMPDRVTVSRSSSEFVTFASSSSPGRMPLDPSLLIARESQTLTRTACARTEQTAAASAGAQDRAAPFKESNPFAALYERKMSGPLSLTLVKDE